MSGVLTLVRHSLRRRRTFLIVAALVLALFQIFMIVVARSIHNSGGFTPLAALMPKFFQQWTNMVAFSFRGIVLFGYSHPLVQLFLVAIAIGVATEPAAEIESKFVDLLMARPVPRSAAIVRSAVVLLAVILGAVGSMYVAQWIGLRLLTPATAEAPEQRVIFHLVINLALLIAAWGAIALTVSAFCNRRATAVAFCGFLAFTMFILDTVARFWSEIATLSRVSPFHYYNPFALIGGASLQMLDLAVLAAIFIAGSALAAIVYASRDL